MNDKLKELYAELGQIYLQLEYLNSQSVRVKQQIVKEMNESKETK